MANQFEPIIFMLLLLIISSACLELSSDGCGTERGCWFQPSECEKVDIKKCISAVEWIDADDEIHFTFRSIISDLGDLSRGLYLAMGISKDQRMGDDSVIECIFDRKGGNDKAYISFNDETSNQRLYQASEVMLINSSAFIENGQMICDTYWMYSRRNDVNQNDRFKVFDLKSQQWTLQIARGYTDSRSGEKFIHSTLDGNLFPWMTDEKVSFCGGNNSCISSTTSGQPHVYVHQMKQTDVSRTWRYRIAVIHGILMIFGWWVIVSSAILLARFFKPIWPNRKLFGTAVWFQLHRDLMIVSVIFQVIGVFLIFYQASFVWYLCSYACTSDDFAKQMHVITGVTATALALFQPFFAFIRPGPDSDWRPAFNWLHWFVGITAWICASTTMILSIPMGKTGLSRNFRQLPNYIMGFYIAVFLLCSILLEVVSSSNEKRYDKPGQSSMEMVILTGPSTESPIVSTRSGIIRLSIFFLHLIVAIATSVAISYMLIWNLLQH